MTEHVNHVSSYDAATARNVVVCCNGTGNEFSTHRSTTPAWSDDTLRNMR